MTKSTRERIKAKRRIGRARSIFIGVLIAVPAIAGVAWLANQARGRQSGEFVEIPQVQVVEVMSSAAHVADDTDPGPYNSDPPTSGRMYVSPAVAGFNDVGDVESFGEYPAGSLVHSLEHGHVIFWYNCDVLSQSECEAMKDGIKQVIRAAGTFKVIAFPWPSIEEPLVMTSWGRMLRFDEFDAEIAEQFVRNFRLQAPEPNAP